MGNHCADETKEFGTNPTPNFYPYRLTPLAES